MSEETSYNGGGISIPAAKSKSLVSKETGEVIYFIDKNYGIKHKLTGKMDFTTVHPIHTNMCEIKGDITRI